MADSSPRRRRVFPRLRPVRVSNPLQTAGLAAQITLTFLGLTLLSALSVGLPAALLLRGGPALFDPQRIENTLWLMGISTAGLAALAVLTGLWFSIRIAKPLKLLAQAANLIAHEQPTDPVPTFHFKRPREVITLADTLEQSRQAMLELIEARTEASFWLESLIDSLTEGVVTFAPGGHITFFSRGAERITGWQAERAEGKHINEVFIPIEAGRTFTDHIPPRGGKSNVAVETAQRGVVILQMTGARLVPPSSSEVNVALVLRDITEEDAAQRLRAHFLANISHEFRTPLSGLKASLEMLLDEDEGLSEREMRELLKPTYLSLLSLQTLIDNLLESSSIEAGHFTIRKRSINLEEVAAEALRMVAPLLDRRKQPVSLALPPQIPPLQADPARLLQVMVNLLSNASKYSPPGEPIDFSIELPAAPGRGFRVAIADRGPGIPPGEQDRLFQRFIRLNTRDNEQYGIGLGLHVVKTIVEEHGGAVGVTARPEGGTVFWFELPQSAVLAAAEQD